MCSVYLKDSEKVVSISSEHLEPVTPTKNNKVCGCPQSWASGLRGGSDLQGGWSLEGPEQGEPHWRGVT